MSENKELKHSLNTEDFTQAELTELFKHKSCRKVGELRELIKDMADDVDVLIAINTIHDKNGGHRITNFDSCSIVSSGSGPWFQYELRLFYTEKE